jgi:hypothetical protein
LERLAQLNPRQAQVVELHSFAGLTEGEAAEVLGVSVKTVKNDWRFAKAWLKNRDGNRFPMTPERHAQIQRIFEAAVDLSGAARDSYLDQSSAPPICDSESRNCSRGQRGRAACAAGPGILCAGSQLRTA